LGIKTFVIFDFREEYHRAIISYIYETYKQWLTPNPDILCNTLVKFKLFLEEWKRLGCDMVATGHYARITQDDAWYHLHKGKDENKDQSYFLSWLNQNQLASSLFPLGELTKPKVREIAKEIWLPNADRKDSQWLCFIGKVSMKDFLKDALPVTTGTIVDEDWNTLGEHEWVWFYTIWQRQWLWLPGWPWYVIRRDITTNTLVVWSQDTQLLLNTHLTAKQRHRVWWTPPSLPFTSNAKIRYRQQDQSCHVSQYTNDVLEVVFDQEQRAISPWQTIALYQWDELIWSGIICE
jgi:tRNA-specific 2-thiouridylase